MEDYKSSRRNEYNWDSFSIKGILLVIAMVFTFTLHANSILEADSMNEIDCLDSNTCMKCTNKSLCSWSIERQACINTKLLQTPANGNQLTVHNEMHCPRFTVVNKSSVVGASFKYTVRISNDVKGAVTSFLNSTAITCCIESCDFRGSVVDDSIVCAAIRTPWSYFADGARALISYIYIMFGDKKLQFDNDADHYYTIYDRDCAASAATTAGADDCATCLWNDEGYKHYLKRCPTSNPCTGSYLIYDKRDADGDKKFLFADDDNDDDDVVSIRCAEISILSVWPLYVPRTGGGTTVTITVRNHRMLSENRTVTVAVAGRRCEDPVTYDDRTITCSLLQSSVTAAAASGPVEVVYAPSSSSARSSQNMKFALRSSETIGFVDPETTSVRPICGSISDGITLTVRGRFLDIGNAVRVSVVANGSEAEVGETVLMTCDIVSRDRHTIVCRTAAAVRHNNASSARVKVQFDGGPIKYVQSPASWTLCSIGDAALDAGQTFGGTISGGTSVPVRGVHFSCVSDALLYVHDRDGAKYQHATNCRVVNDTYMVCRSPDIRRASSTVGNVATTAVYPNFGVRARDCGDGREFELPVLQHQQQQRLPATTVRSPFSVYADPVYVDFEIRNGTVVISSGHTSPLGQGYAAGDVAVRFRNSTGGCHVTSLSQHEIVCEPTSATTATVLDQLQRIAVIVGGDGGYECDVQKKSIDARNIGGRIGDRGRSLLFTSSTFSCCSGVAIVSAATLLFAVGVLLFRIVTKNRYVISADT